MTSRLRFMTARQVFEAFPAAEEDVAAPPTDDDPLVFMTGLIDAGAAEDALGFASYVLPRREAVWWGCQCLRAMGAIRDDAGREVLTAAEAWVRNPEEDKRRAALDLAQACSFREPATWLALAAGWSGGSMVAAEFDRVPPPPHLTARAIRSALTLSLGTVDQTLRPEWAKRCAISAVRFAAGGEATP